MCRRHILLILAFLFTTACGADSTAAYKVIYQMDSLIAADEGADSRQAGTIAFVGRKTEDGYFEEAAKGVREAALGRKEQLLFEIPDTPEPSSQADTIDRLVDRGIDVLAVAPADADEVAPALFRAASRGVQVVTWDTDTTLLSRKFFVEPAEPDELGKHLLAGLARSMGEEGGFALLARTGEAGRTAEVLNGIEAEYRDTSPRLTLLATVDTGKGAAHTGSSIRELIARHGDLRGFIALAPADLGTAAEAIRDAGAGRKIHLVAMAGPSDAAPWLRKGALDMAVMWSPRKLGYVTATLALQLLDHRMPSDGQRIESAGTLLMIGNKAVMGEPLDFTRENVDRYDY